MTIFQYFILGLIQGLTELLPVSSSAHLVLIPTILNWELQSTTVDILVHSGTLAALILFYKKRLEKILKNFLHHKTKTLVLITISTIPALIIGFLFEDLIDRYLKSIPIMLGSLTIVGICLVIIGRRKFENKKEISKLSLRNALSIGFFQATAFIRGTSRSGITIIGSLLNGLSLQKAADYAFLVSIPIIGLATVKGVFDFTLDSNSDINPIGLSVAFFTSFLTSLLMLSIFKKVLDKLWIFGVYRILLALVIFILIYIT